MGDSRAILYLSVVAAAAIGVLALVQTLTREAIAEQRAAAERAALNAALPATLRQAEIQPFTIDGTRLALSPEETAWRVLRGHRVAAVVFPVRTTDGYAGAIDLLIGVNAMGQLTGVRVVAHRETPGLGDKIEADRADWIAQFNGLSLQQPSVPEWQIVPDGGVFDAFAGATITPRAVVAAIKQGLMEAQRQNSQWFSNDSAD